MNVKFFYQVFTIVSVSCGAVIGAGFISGRELVSFFDTQNVILGLAFELIFFTICFWFLFDLGIREKGLNGLNSKLYKNPKPLNFAVILSSFISVLGMLAGLGEITKGSSVFGNFPVLSVVILLIVSFTSKKGIKGVEKASVILVPLIILTVFVLIIKKGAYDFTVSRINPLKCMGKSIMHVSMNAFMNLPAIVDVCAGKSKKTAFISALITSLLLLAFAGIILITVKGAGTENAEMPLYTALGGNNAVAFTLSLIFAMASSVISAYYPVYNSVYKAGEKVKGKLGGNIAVILLAVLAFFLSRIGLKGIVDYFYPIVSVFGIVYLISCAVYTIKNKKVPYKKNLNADNRNINSGGIMKKKNKNKVAHLTDEDYAKYIMALKDEKPPLAVRKAQKED